ncbi:MAG: GGDEF domain-containing protein [Sphaerochaeta sp.]|jgi:diguanylate cyclase (GGDEF)-like protein|nr:GGDEF domain-containing protein [Sphaerochaeta sp.]PKL28976.1 MAG: hypothetical protein CVV46_04025 [Spirochaetae bacterium HGW-Spirochaetae-2]
MYDQSTIAFFGLVFHGLFAIVYFTLWLSNRDHVAGLGYWTINLLFHVFGRIVVLTDVSQSTQIGAVVGNLSTGIGAVLFYFGLAAFTKTTINKNFYYSFLVILAIASVWSSSFIENQYVRSIVADVAILFITSRYLVLIWKNRNANPWYRRPYMVLLLVYGVFTVTFIMRTVFDTIALYNGDLLPAFDSPQLRMSQLFALIILSIVNFCILILSNNALLKDLANDSLEKDKMMDKLKILAQRDGLTGLFNRNAVEQYLDSAIEQAKSGCPCMVTLVDIDNFKQINDTYGHECGDMVLVHLANIFSTCIRERDTVGRWGGDEFLFIHKEITPEQATVLVHRLHQAVDSYDWKSAIHTKDTKVSISSGFTTCSGAESKRKILRRADLNLYTAKENGRSQAVGS